MIRIARLASHLCRFSEPAWLILPTWAYVEAWWQQGEPVAAFVGAWFLEICCITLLRVGVEMIGMAWPRVRS